MKYAVAVFNHFEGVNEVKIVDVDSANSDLEAVILAAGDEEIKESLLGDFNTVDELIGYYSNAEISVSKPVRID